VPVVCPRCGGYGYETRERRGGRYYIFVVHRVRVGRQTKVRKCYIGPAEGYEHAEQLHGLGLTNVAEQDYLEVAREALERYVARILEGASSLLGVPRTEEELRKVEEEIARRLEEKARELEEVAELARKLAAKLKEEAELYRARSEEVDVVRTWREGRGAPRE